MTIYGIDIGLSGGVSNGDYDLKMPTYKRLTKKAYMVQKKDAKGKAVVTKSGPNKGQKQMVIKSPAKYRNEIDTPVLYKWLNDADYIVIEAPGNTQGNSARVTKTTMTNFGKVLACAELSNAKVIIVPPSQWKKDLNLSKEKQDSIDLCEKLSGRKHKITWDGPAEAYLIRHWFMTVKLPQLEKES